MSSDWMPDLGCVGASCTYTLELQMNGGTLNREALMTREQMRAALEAADDTIDVVAEWQASGAPQLNQTVEMAREMDGLDVGMHVFPDVRWEPRGLHGALYERVGRALGKRFLTRLDAHPEDRDLPVTHPAFRGMPQPTLDQLIPCRDLMPTGFQIGWAANAAKFVHQAKPTPNPAVLNVEGDRDTVHAALNKASVELTATLRRRERRHPPKPPGSS